MRNAVIGFLVLLCLVALSGQGRAASLDSLVQSIATADNQQLSKMTFFELNILKNAIYSAKGFKYADDRQWLNEYFYGNNSKLETNSSELWDLSKYDFPSPVSGAQFKTNPVMEKAIANIRVALFKKIKLLDNASTINLTITNNYGNHYIKYTQLPNGKWTGQYLRIFGRKIKIHVGNYRESLSREAQGYRCLLDIIETKRDFDACELLGVYVGSVVMLKNIIEAQNGKIFDGIMGWEISQLAGITPSNAQYDENKLDEKTKMKLKVLETIIKKMTSSGIGDVPAQFKNQGITVDLYYEEGC